MASQYILLPSDGGFTLWTVGYLKPLVPPREKQQGSPSKKRSSLPDSTKAGKDGAISLKEALRVTGLLKRGVCVHSPQGEAGIAKGSEQERDNGEKEVRSHSQVSSPGTDGKDGGSGLAHTVCCACAHLWKVRRAAPRTWEANALLFPSPAYIF